MTLGITDDDGALLGTCTLDQLRTLARRSCPHHPHHPGHPDQPPGDQAAGDQPGDAAGHRACDHHPTPNRP